MTALTRPVRRETSTIHRGRPPIATMTPEGVYLREKGRRTRFLLPWGAAYQRAAQLEVNRQLAERAARRKAEKKSKAARRTRR